MPNIMLKQYNASVVTPKDDAMLYDFVTNKQCGIISGCEITWAGTNQFNISAGYGLIRGRVFEIAAHTIYAKLPTASGVTYNGYIFAVMDLGNDSEPIKIDTIATATVTDEWEQNENVNLVNGMWEMPLAEYRATNTAVTSYTEVAPKLTSIVNIIKSFSELAALTESGYVADARMMKEQILTFTNKTVAVSSWQSNSDYEDYAYRAAVSCTGVSTAYVPYVTFNMADAASGNFGAVADTSSGAVLVYAKEAPDSMITIPTIQCIRKVG